MNWTQLLTNILGMFALGYSAASAAGQPPKIAASAGLVGVLTNLTGLFQRQPHVGQ